jgi:PAS domain S-box-containing protein
MERERFSELFENVPDPIAEVTFEDGEPIVQYLNPAFREVFGYDDTTLRGENLNDFIVPVDGHEAARGLDERLRAGEHASREVRRTTLEGRRDFLLRAIPYERGDAAYGFVVYTDITDQKERERYFQVLNRVLRHNLRNDMTVVLGLAEYLADHVEDPDLAAQASRLHGKADTVSSLVEKAKEIEDLVGRRDTPAETTDLVPLLADTVAELRAAHPAAEITLDTPETAHASCSSEIKRAVVELVENAVEHGSTNPDSRARENTLEHGSASPGFTDHHEGADHGATPRIRIVVDTDWPGEVTIAVHDDGPGIPDEEWETVVGDADITQLNHGTGLGLWLTRWIVESFDGELRRRSDDDGAAVVVGLREPAA